MIILFIILGLFFFFSAFNVSIKVVLFFVSFLKSLCSFWPHVCSLWMSPWGRYEPGLRAVCPEFWRQWWPSTICPPLKFEGVLGENFLEYSKGSFSVLLGFRRFILGPAVELWRCKRSVRKKSALSLGLLALWAED